MKVATPGSEPDGKTSAGETPSERRAETGSDTGDQGQHGFGSCFPAKSHVVIKIDQVHPRLYVLARFRE
jgi:hypothetical protein